MRITISTVCRLSLLLVLLLCVACPLAAQSDQQIDRAIATENESDWPRTVLMTQLEPDGALTLMLTEYATADAKPAPLPFDLLAPIAGCPVQPFTNSDPQWTSGFCPERLPISNQANTIWLHLEPLARVIRPNHINSLQIEVFVPGGVNLKCPAGFTRASPRRCLATTDLDKQNLGTIGFQYSYSGASGAQLLLVLGGIFLAGPLLTCWLWWSASRAKTEDTTGVWFSYVRFIQWSFIVPFFAWLGAVDSLEPLKWLSLFGPRWAAYDSDSSAWPAWVVTWIPPLLSWFLCVALSFPVRKKLQRVRMTLLESLLQAFLFQASTWIPLALFLQGFFQLFSDERWAPAWWVSALAMRIVAVPLLLRVSGMQPQAITQGSLRDRAFALAKRMDVKLRNVYFMPTSRAPMANAFAHRARMIFLTDYLLEKLNRNEVDAVIGHELGHLKRNHSVKLLTAYLLFLAAMFWIKPYLMQFLHLPEFTQYLVLSIPPLIGAFAFSRRFEYEADQEAAAATEQPESVVTALAKITRLNSMPIRWGHWDELLLTHPSTLRRARAVLNRAGIGTERIQALLAAASQQTNGADHYPSPVDVKSKIYSTAYRMRAQQLASWTVSLFAVLFPAFVAMAVHQLHLGSALRPQIYAAGFVATAIGYFWLFGSAGYWLLPSLKKKLESRAVAEGFDPAAVGASFVGLAPGSTPQLYEGNMSWDAGFLLLTRDKLVYWGEESRFALTRSQVESIQTAPDFPGWLATARPILRWRETPEGLAQMFSLQPLDTGSMFDRRQKMGQLIQLLACWERGESADAALPPAAAELRPPMFGEVTGTAAELFGQPQFVIRGVIFILFLAACASLAFGLPFGVSQLLDWRYDPAGAGAFSLWTFDLGAWYVICTSEFMSLLALWPLLRYRRASRRAARAPAAPVRA